MFGSVGRRGPTSPSPRLWPDPQPQSKAMPQLARIPGRCVTPVYAERPGSSARTVARNLQGHTQAHWGAEGHIGAQGHAGTDPEHPGAPWGSLGQRQRHSARRCCARFSPSTPGRARRARARSLAKNTLGPAGSSESAREPMQPQPARSHDASARDISPRRATLYARGPAGSRLGPRELDGALPPARGVLCRARMAIRGTTSHDETFQSPARHEGGSALKEGPA